jgi:hypothetical protein
MLDYVAKQPDAVALLLLVALVGGTLVVGLWAGRRRDRRGPEPTSSQGTVTTWPHLLRLEVVAGLAVLLAVTWWAILAELPLGPPADGDVTPTLAKAPWFFVGVQETLQYFDAWLAGAVLPLIMIVGLCALPYLDPDAEGGGHYSLGERPVALAVTLGLVLIWLLPMVVGALFRGEQWALQPVWQPPPLEPPLPPVQLPSLADRLGLEGAAAHLAGGGLCLGPYLVLLALWPLLRRRRSWAARMGAARFLIAGFFLLTAVGVAAKVVLLAVADVRYLWVTPWFRI